MRKISLSALTLVFLFSILFSLNAQSKMPKFSYGLSTDVVSIPLSEKSLQSNVTTAFVSFYPTNNLHFKVGVGENLLREVSSKRYQALPELMIGTGYTVFRSGIVSNDISLSVANSFHKFSEFRDYHADLSVRFKLVDAFFIGAGLRYQHHNANDLLVVPVDGVTIFMELGIQLYIGRNHNCLNKKS